MKESIEVIHGDCLKVLKTLSKGSVDIIITSPPYNLKIGYNDYKDNLEDVEYVKWFDKISKQLKRVLKDDGSFFLNFAGSNTFPQLPHFIAIKLQERFILQNTIHWIKSISVDKSTYGHFKPINSKRFLHNGHEFIFHFTKMGKVELDRLAVGVPYQDKTNLKRRNHKKDLRCRGNTWFIPYSTVQSKNQKYNHPCPYPVLLPEMCIKLHGKKNITVLDPFAGIFTTGVAAKNIKCNFIGIDSDKKYCKIGAEILKVKMKTHTGE